MTKFKNVMVDALKNGSQGKAIDMSDTVTIPKSALVIIHGINRFSKPYVLLGVDNSCTFLKQENQELFASLEQQGVRVVEAKPKK